LRRESDTAEDYLSRIKDRLEAEGFLIKDDIIYKHQHFDYVAKRTRLESDKMSFITNAYLFTRFASLDVRSLREFSKVSFKYSERHLGILWPRSLFYGIGCFPVVIVNSIDSNTADYVRNHVRKHWAAWEMPVIYNLASRELYYFELTPSYGGLYWEQMRMTIYYMLSPE